MKEANVLLFGDEHFLELDELWLELALYVFQFLLVLFPPFLSEVEVLRGDESVLFFLHFYNYRFSVHFKAMATQSLKTHEESFKKRLKTQLLRIIWLY